MNSYFELYIVKKYCTMMCNVYYMYTYYEYYMKELYSMKSCNANPGRSQLWISCKRHGHALAMQIYMTWSCKKMYVCAMKSAKSHIYRTYTRTARYIIVNYMNIVCFKYIYIVKANFRTLHSIVQPTKKTSLTSPFKAKPLVVMTAKYLLHHRCGRVDMSLFVLLGHIPQNQCGL